MPRKRANIKVKHAEIPAAAWHIFSDGLYPVPADGADMRWFHFFLKPGQRESWWQEIRDEILESFAAKYPSRRPAIWWDLDAPRMSVAEVERHGWLDCSFALDLPEPRRRLGGRGAPSWEHLAYVPEFDCGVPARWITSLEVSIWPRLAPFAVDPQDPPRFESQAAFLRRHNLFLPGEQRRLTPADFEPEIVRIEEDAE